MTFEKLVRLLSQVRKKKGWETPFSKLQTCYLHGSGSHLIREMGQFAIRIRLQPFRYLRIFTAVMVGFHLQSFTPKKNVTYIVTSHLIRKMGRHVRVRAQIACVLNLVPHCIFNAFFCFCTVFGSIYVATGL